MTTNIEYVVIHAKYDKTKGDPIITKTYVYTDDNSYDYDTALIDNNSTAHRLMTTTTPTAEQLSDFNRSNIIMVLLATPLDTRLNLNTKYVDLFKNVNASYDEICENYNKQVDALDQTDQALLLKFVNVISDKKNYNGYLGNIYGTLKFAASKIKNITVGKTTETAFYWRKDEIVNYFNNIMKSNSYKIDDNLVKRLTIMLYYGSCFINLIIDVIENNKIKGITTDLEMKNIRDTIIGDGKIIPTEIKGDLKTAINSGTIETDEKSINEVIDKIKGILDPPVAAPVAAPPAAAPPAAAPAPAAGGGTHGGGGATRKISRRILRRTLKNIGL